MNFNFLQNLAATGDRRQTACVTEDFKGTFYVPDRMLQQICSKKTDLLQ